MTRLALLLLLAAVAPLGAQSDRGSDVPSPHRPPPGMCRIWIDGVPAARQPAPTDCATAMRRRPPNARVVFGDEVRTQRLDRPTVQPRVASPPTAMPRTLVPAPPSPQPTQPSPSPADTRRVEPPRAERPPQTVHAPPRMEPPRVRKPPSRPKGRMH